MSIWRSRTFIAIAVATMATVVFSILVLFQGMSESRDDRQQLREADAVMAQQLKDAEQEAARQNAFAEALQRQIEELGEQPIVVTPPVGSVAPNAPIYLEPSAEQVLDSLRAIVPSLLLDLCDGDCKGEQGEQGVQGLPGTPGVDGKDGKNGRGIASMVCVIPPGQEPFEFSVTYSDGTQEVVQCEPASDPDEPVIEGEANG